jgi:phosphoglucosamine mutase
LRAVVSSGKTLAELKKDMPKYPQVMINVQAANTSKLENNTIIARAIAEAELALGDTGRVLLRPSGTEPVVRVMVEGEQAAQVETLARQLAKVVEAELG